MLAPTAAAISDALLAAARALVPDLPEHAVAVPAPASYGRGATLFVTVDQVEHTRRQRAGLRAITRIEHLGLLLGLPAWEPVPVGSLDRRDQQLLRHLPAAAVHVEAGHVTRTAVRPVTVHLALLPGTATRTTIERATAYAPFCARAILAAALPRDKGVLAEADFWGVGVAYRSETLVPPTPWRPQRHTAAGWLFTENVYEQVLAQRVATQEA
ncbi:hypothetical protein OG455_41490 [Kitasatospora sp. NBC_01287]|uniref:hypothetical protein n=1 Tax=Kitasatospora sp. NBC_01287 TaxID=2903573 RepID=UPI002251CE49|nr:hypothetical protein [Kitasatospora sp. NBC_01287]MCX4750958.1 hypothetical protein [Kitasatospora sp. NBC_01287]MCX4751791.1 hypothetical protein [Kitasatospora sp. NBC_01287]MCX4751917.1 hypothetical protein [Kitasatospora sp. NBC_01287]